MITNPRRQNIHFTHKRNKRNLHSERTIVTKQPERTVIRQLQDALWESSAITSILWNYRTKDWVTNVHAIDFDNDGDIEVLLSSRDGIVRVQTPMGAKKWEWKQENKAISAMFALPISLLTESTTAYQRQACIIVGTREGDLYAIDQNGKTVKNWHYTTGRMIRQIYATPQLPNCLLVGSEDRCIHFVDRRTGEELYPPLKTGGWVRSVFAYDIDGDGECEILVGSGDDHLYILNSQGQLLDKLFLAHQIYAMLTAPLIDGGPVRVITSSNRKNLFTWTIHRATDGRWSVEKVWETQPEQALFGNRIHTIFVHDIDGDHQQEILLGAEDGYLYILNIHGQLLLKRRFGSSVYSIWAMDINNDGQQEILVGTEDNGVYVVQFQINDEIYNRVKNVYNEIITNQEIDDIKALKELTPREKATLKEFVDETSPFQRQQMEVDRATQLMRNGNYEQAIKLFLRARRQNVQYCWEQPVLTQGYIWSLGIGKIENHKDNHLIVGTDEGYISAIDVTGGEQHVRWSTNVHDRVRMLQIIELHSGEIDSIVAVLANHHMVILNAQGEIMKEHTFSHAEDWARCLEIDMHKEDYHRAPEILVGLENKQIAIWDANIEHERKTINTPQGINILCTAEVTQSGRSDVIAGSIKDLVVVYDNEGNERWRFQTQDRVLAIDVADIDLDGHPEVVVGSEDRNVYVIDHEGHLKWRYRTPRAVNDVTVCSTRQSGENEGDTQPEMLDILIGCADGYVYILSPYGDLRWKYQSANRVKALRARKIIGDKKVEIALATENKLELLQIIDQTKLFAQIQDCWNRWLDTREDRHAALMELTHHSDDFIRSFALVKLAGQQTRHEEDIRRLLEASRTDDALEVKRELVRAIIVLYIVTTNKEENTRQARNLLNQFAADPDPEIRLAIVNILPKLLELDEGICFSYLEYFTHNIDLWVRRAVVRQIDTLTEKYAARAFKLLLNTVNDPDEWIRQETARALAHYFDVHPQNTIRDSIELISTRIKIDILQQISYSAHKPEIKSWFQSLAHLIDDVDKPAVITHLDEIIAATSQLQQFDPIYSEDYRQIYTEFRRLQQIHSSGALAVYQWYNVAEETTAQSYAIIRVCLRTFDRLQEVATIMQAFERREEVRDRMTSLINATDTIESIRNDLQLQELAQKESFPQGYRLPELAILQRLVEQVYQLIKAEINRQRGSAELVAEIRNKEVHQEEHVVISLQVTNNGVSTADNVTVDLLAAPQQFRIIGEPQRSLIQVPNKNWRSVEFTIQPHIKQPRLEFHITYDDAEKRGKQTDFADVITLYNDLRPYIEIPNPYTSGTPIRDTKMFYGRRNDIETLTKKLSSVTANKVVVLSGQRRMGKTSLVYQLANNLEKGKQLPVLIDLQRLAAVQNTSQFFMGLAQYICEEALRRKQLILLAPQSAAFNDNPTASFDAFLAETLRTLHDEKLVFMLDEFETLQEKINNGPLNLDVLHYLRSQMQHREGLNFLLVGTPNIRNVTEPSWSVFFNIALQHSLNKLKPDEADALITEPVKESLVYDMLALERMHQLSGDLPYFIHVLSEILINYSNLHHRSYITVNDINSVLDTVLEEQSSSIQWIWDQPKSALERFLLALLAQNQSRQGSQIFTLSDIYREFDAQGLPYEQDKVTAAFKNLVRADIVEEQQNGMHYRIPIGLFREWLRKAKSPQRVIREEFTGKDFL